MPFAVSDHVARGGEGALPLARVLIDTFGAYGKGAHAPLRFLYELEDGVPDKVRKVAREMYGARDALFTEQAQEDLRQIERLGLSRLPVCIAKTQSSLSDDAKRRGRPRDFDITVRALRVNSGAGFIVVLTGNIVRMPGLPREPLAEHIDVVDGEITGLR